MESLDRGNCGDLLMAVDFESYQGGKRANTF